MTTPDIAMPVSFTLVRQAGDDQLRRVDGGDHYRLEGPSLVSASWSGPQKAEIWHHHNTGAGFQWRKLAEFNGGGEPRSELGQNPANQSWCMSVLQRLRRMWPRTTEGRSRSIRSSSWDGGVNDGTIGNGLDALTGHQAHIVSEFGARTDRRRQGRQRHRDHLLASCRCASNRDRLRREQVDVTLRGVTQAVRHGWSTQRENRPCGDGESRGNRHVCLDRDAGQSTTGGCDYLPSPGVLTTAVAGGGTLNDGTTGNGLDAVPGHQTCQYGGRRTGRDSGRSWAERHGHRFLATRRCAPAHAGFRRGAVDVALHRVSSHVRDEWAAQGPHRPSHHGPGGDCQDIRLNGRPVEASPAGCDDFPSPRLAIAGVAA